MTNMAVFETLAWYWRRGDSSWAGSTTACSANLFTVLCHHIVSVYLHVGAYGSCCTVCCLCVMPGTQRLAEGQWAEWTAAVGWLYVHVCCCTTVGEYYDIKHYHSGLCALTQGTLCTFVQGWGVGGEASMVAVCLLCCLRCSTTVLSLGKSYVKYNRKAVAWKQ